MATHTATVRATIQAVIQGISQLWADSFTVTSVSETPVMYGSVGTTFETIYDASQTTIPPIGDSDPGDQPFLFAIKVSLQDLWIRYTDDAANVWHKRVPAGAFYLDPDGRGGLTTARRTEQIDIAAVTGTADYAYILQHD